MSEVSLVGGLGKLTEPLSKLVNRVAEAAERHGQPRHIRRVAQAEADATLIEARAEIEKNELYQRAATRIVNEAVIDQENIEAVITTAGDYLDDDFDPAEMTDEWIRRLLDSAKYASEEAARQMLAKLLAGEANSPGKYSKRTISILSNMEKHEVESFQLLISFAAYRPGAHSLLPLVFGGPDDFYVQNGLTFRVLSTLQELGLITFDTLGGFRRNGLGQVVTVPYFDINVSIDLKSKEPHPEPPYSLPLGSVLLTMPGDELASLLVPTRVDGFPELLLQQYRKDGYKASITPMDTNN